MRDLLLWRLLQRPTLDPAELTPLLDRLADSGLRERTPFLGLLGPALAHPDAGLRRAAIRVAAGAAGRSGLQRQVAMLNDAEDGVRRAAADSLRVSVIPDPLRWVHALFHPAEAVRRDAIDPARAFPPPLSYKLYLLADPACRDAVLADFEGASLDGQSLPLLFSLLRQGVVPPDVARRLGAAVPWSAWVTFLGDLLPRTGDMASYLDEAMRPAWLDDLFSHYVPDRLDELLLLLYDEDPPGDGPSPHERFFGLLWSVVLAEDVPFRQWIAFTLLGIAVQRGTWPAAAARVVAVCHPPFLDCPWVPMTIRRAALPALFDARERCTRLPAAVIEPIAKSNLCRAGDGALDLSAATAVLAALDGDPLAALIGWFGVDAVRAAFEADRGRGVAILSLPTASAWQRARFIRDFCSTGGADRFRELSALVVAVPADGLDFLDSLDGPAACQLLGRLLELEGGRGLSENKVRRLAARLAVPIAAGQVARFLGVWLAREAPEASALCSAILTRLIHEHASRLVLPAIAGLEPGPLRRFLAVLPFCAGYPYDDEIALARRLDTHADAEIRVWAVARLRDHSAILAARARAEESSSSGPMPPAEPVLRVGLCASLAARPDPAAPDVDTCQALLASHDPEADVVAQLARFVSDEPAFETALDVAMVEHWKGEPRLPALGHAWLFRWDDHRTRFAATLHERGFGTVLREAAGWPPAVARRVWDAGYAVLESWRWHDDERLQDAWDGRLSAAVVAAMRTPVVDVAARICLHGVQHVRGGRIHVLTGLHGRLLPLLLELDEAGRALFRGWIDTTGLSAAPTPERPAPELSLAHSRFRAGMGRWDATGEGPFDELLALVCEPAETPWLGSDEYGWLVDHCDDYRGMSLRLRRCPHPLGVMNAVQALVTFVGPDPEIRDGLLAALEDAVPLMGEHRLLAARWLYDNGERLRVLPLLLADESAEEPSYPAQLCGVPAPVVSAVAAGVLMVGDGEAEGRLVAMLEHGRAFTGVWSAPDHRSGNRADRVDPVGRADALGQVLAGASSTEARGRARRALRSGMGRSNKLRRVAETFAWGVRIGRQLTGKLFTLEMIAGEALGYTRLRENKLYISPLPLLRGQQNGREVVRGLILHEFGHHLYHKGESAEAIWEGAQNEGLGKLLNLVSDEHLERNLRVMDESFGNQLKQLGAFAFQHTAREVGVQTLLDALRGKSFAVLGATHLGVARRDACVLVNSGRVLLEMERAGVSFARFFRALRMGLGNRHDDPKVARGLALFDKGFRKNDMEGLMEVTRKLREIFGEETDLLDSFEQDSALMGDFDELSEAAEGITNEELQSEIRRTLEGRVTTGRTPRPGKGGAGAGRTYNLAPEEEFSTIDKVVPRIHDRARHAHYAERVARPARQMRQFLQHLGLGVVPRRMRTQGRTFDRARIRPLVLRGDPRVLIARETRTVTDLFLGVLLDCSGSMASDDNIEKAKLFGTLLAESARGLRGVTLRLWGFTDQTIYDCGDAARPAVHDLEPEDANNDSAALWHASQVARASNRRAKVLVMISDGSPAGCSVASLKALVQRLTTRQKMLCAQVAVRPLDDVCFPHYVLLENDNLDECVRRFGAVMMRLVRQALKG